MLNFSASLSERKFNELHTYAKGLSQGWEEPRSPEAVRGLDKGSHLSLMVELLAGLQHKLSVEALEQLHGVGGRIMVTPNTNPAVIARGAELGLDLLPGFMTPSEAFAAIAAGARRIKLFPAARLGPAYVKAIKDVLPKHIGVWAVGGTGADTIGEWLTGGCEGIGVGGALYRPGDDATLVGARGRDLVAAWKACL